MLRPGVEKLGCLEAQDFPQSRLFPVTFSAAPANLNRRTTPERERTAAENRIMKPEHTSVRGIPLFSHLSNADLRAVESVLRLAVYQPGETVVREGAPVSCLLYIIVEGEAALCKEGRSPLTGEALNYEIDVRGRHDIFGAVPVLDGQPMPVTVIAKTPLTVAILDLKRGNPAAPGHRIRNTMLTELRRHLANHVRSAFENRAASLQREAEFARYRNAVGSIVIAALALLSFYTLTLNALPRFESYIKVNFALSPVIIIFSGAFFFPLILRSGFPAAFFGLRLDNWRQALPFTAGWSLVFIVILVAVKWLLIASLPPLRGLPVVSFADVRIGGAGPLNSGWYWAAAFIYLMLTPVQEFVARAGIQAPLYAFLQGSEFRRGGLSIVVSNFVFSAVHAHIGLAFALASFIPGLFWGWIFLRTNSLLAASLSHLMIGGAGIFLFGIEEFVQRLV